MGIYKNLKNTKVQRYRDDATDPKTGHWVSDIYHLHYTKLNRPCWSMKWNYYRHRGRLSVRDFIAKHKGETIRITWAGPPPEGCDPQTIIKIDEENYPEFFPKEETQTPKEEAQTPEEEAGKTPEEEAGKTPEEEAGKTPEEEAGKTPEEEASESWFNNAEKEAKIFRDNLLKRLHLNEDDIPRYGVTHFANNNHKYGYAIGCVSKDIANKCATLFEYDEKNWGIC